MIRMSWRCSSGSNESPTKAALIPPLKRTQRLAALPAARRCLLFNGSCLFLSPQWTWSSSWLRPPGTPAYISSMIGLRSAQSERSMISAARKRSCFISFLLQTIFPFGRNRSSGDIWLFRSDPKRRRTPPYARPTKQPDSPQYCGLSGCFL